MHDQHQADVASAGTGRTGLPHEHLSGCRAGCSHPVEHARGGSWATVGGFQRECTCGASWYGSAEETFGLREAHIAEAGR